MNKINKSAARFPIGSKVVGRNGSGFVAMTGIVRSAPSVGCAGDTSAVVVLVEWVGSWAGQGSSWVRVESLS